VRYRLEFRPAARKAFLALPRAVRDRVGRRLEALAEEPRSGDVKPLKGKLKGALRLRVGDCRVLFLRDDQERILDVLRVGHREDFYD